MYELALDVIYIGDLAFLCHYIGLPLVTSCRGLSQASLIAGLSILGVATTLLYAAGLSIYSCSVLFHAVATGSFLWSWKRRGWRLLAVRGQRDSTSVTIYVLAAAALLVLMLPKWRGGLQFSIFQGNQWDHFGYLESAAGYASRPHHFFTTIGVRHFIENPVWLIARDNLPKRPTVPLMFAVTAGGLFFKSAMIRLSYPFAAFLLFQSVMAIRYLLHVLATAPGSAADRRSDLPIVHMLIGMVAALGFWGQYAFDINAWSQLAGTPIMVAIVATALFLVTRVNPSGERFRSLVVLAVLVSGCLYAYPETLMFHAPALTTMLVLAGLVGFAPWQIVGTTLAALALGLAPGVLYYEGTIGFCLRQARYGLQGHSSYWTYFQRFLFGRGDLLEELLDSAQNVLALRGSPDRAKSIGGTDWFLFLRTTWLAGQGWLAGIGRSCELAASLAAGALGLYFYTPIAALSPAARVVWSVLLLLFCILLVQFAMTASLERVRSAWRRDGNAHIWVLFMAFTLALAGEGLIFLARRQFWSAGKALSFISPYAVVLLLVPLFDRLGTRRPSRWRIGIEAVLLCTYVTAQLGLGFYRAVKATAPNGIHFAPTSYPSIQHDAVNTKSNYNLASIEDAMARIRVKRSSLVEVAVSDTWVREYLITWLTIDDRKFFVRDQIRSYFSAGQPLGYQDYHALNGGAAPDGLIRERWTYDPAVMRPRYILVAD